MRERKLQKGKIIEGAYKILRGVLTVYKEIYVKILNIIKENMWWLLVYLCF